MSPRASPSASRNLHGQQLALLLRPTPRGAAELLDALRGLGLRQITQCRLTNNRNVMVSFGNGDLRVHEGYLAAPDDILLAIVRFVEASTRRERSRARQQLLEYPIETPPQRRRRETSHPDDIRAAERLAAAHAQYNAQFFGGQLRSIAVRVSRRMRSHLGHYSAATPAGDPPEIAISRRHLRRDGFDGARQTLLHEMVHQWQDEHGLAVDHGSTFRAKAREVGISPFARRPFAA